MDLFVVGFTCSLLSFGVKMERSLVNKVVLPICPWPSTTSFIARHSLLSFRNSIRNEYISCSLRVSGTLRRSFLFAPSSLHTLFKVVYQSNRGKVEDWLERSSVVFSWKHSWIHRRNSGAVYKSVTRLSRLPYYASTILVSFLSSHFFLFLTYFWAQVL